jgi:hypothetical protein
MYARDDSGITIDKCVRDSLPSDELLIRMISERSNLGEPTHYDGRLDAKESLALELGKFGVG